MEGLKTMRPVGEDKIRTMGEWVNRMTSTRIPAGKCEGQFKYKSIEWDKG